MENEMIKLKMIGSLFLTTAISLAVAQTDFPKLTGPYLGQKPPGMTPEIFAPGIVSTNMYNHCTVSISPDGKKLFFSSNRPLPQGMTRRERIWCAERSVAGWGVPVPLGPEINDEHLHWQVSVDASGNLYFGSERAGSKGRDDVFMAEFVNGAYRKPVSLGPEINPGAHEDNPFIAPDGSHIIFCRDGLWISFRQNDGSWTKAKNMGGVFKGASCPYVSPDQKYIFFLKMGQGYNDIWWADARIIEELRPK